MRSTPVAEHDLQSQESEMIEMGRIAGALVERVGIMPPCGGPDVRSRSVCCRGGRARHNRLVLTPGSTTAKASCSSISRMRFILRPRSTTTWPGKRDAEREPSPILLPVLIG